MDFPPLADGLSRNTSKRGGERNQWGGYTTVICSQKVLPPLQCSTSLCLSTRKGTHSRPGSPLGHCGLISACPSLSCLHRAPPDTLTPYLLVLYRVSQGGCIRNTGGSREGMVAGKQAGKVSLHLLGYILDFDHVNAQPVEM